MGTDTRWDIEAADMPIAEVRTLFDSEGVFNDASKTYDEWMNNPQPGLTVADVQQLFRR